MADLSYCDDCGGYDGCRDSCKWMAPIMAQRAKAAADKADLEALATLRSDQHIDRVLNEISKLSGAARDSDDPSIQYTYNKLWVLLRGGSNG